MRLDSQCPITTLVGENEDRLVMTGFELRRTLPGRSRKLPESEEPTIGQGGFSLNGLFSLSGLQMYTKSG
jgi:hypothetical protein